MAVVAVRLAAELPRLDRPPSWSSSPRSSSDSPTSPLTPPSAPAPQAAASSSEKGEDDAPNATRLAAVPVMLAQPRPPLAVTKLTEQVEHSSSGVRKAAALALGRLGEAAVRRGLSEVALEHAGVLSELHMDTSAGVREAAALALAHVKAAVGSHSGLGSFDALLDQQLWQYRSSAEYAEHAASIAREGNEGYGLMRVGSVAVLQAKEVLGAQLKRTASEGALLQPPATYAQATLSSSSREKPNLRQTLAENSSKRRWVRPRCHDVEQAEKQEIMALVRKPSDGPAAIQEQARGCVNNLDHFDAGVRASAAIALGRLGPAGALHAGELRRKLVDTDGFVRAAAAVSLSQVAPPSKGSSGTRSSRTSRGNKSGRSGASSRPRSAPRSVSNVAARPRPASDAARGAAHGAQRPRPASAGAARGHVRPASVGAARRSSQATSRPTSPKLARGGRLRSASPA